MGYNLDRTLIKHKSKLSGILNGIDHKLWNPATDRLLAHNYKTDDSLTQIESAKSANKAALEKRFRLETGRRPWVGAVTRLVPQKGPELLEETMHYTLAQGGIFVLLGSSPIPSMQSHFDALKVKYKNHTHLLLQFDYDEALAHLIYAALDFTIVPSHFEPCGLTQLIAMRYGTIPIVRSTGGLKDTVFDCDDHTVPTPQRNGFTFSAPSDLVQALERAFQVRNKDSATFQSLIRRSIQSDFSWKKPAEQYLKLYRKITPVESAQAPRIVARSTLTL
jgi:ADP-glucose type glycogen/starch synthase